MKNIKLLIVFLCLVSIIVAITLLYRRTNVLLSHYENVSRDLTSVKKFLTKNAKPNSVKLVTGAANGESGPPQRGLPQRSPTQMVFNKAVLEKKVNTEPFDKIKHTQDNIKDLRASIEAMEDMISSSSGYSSEEADDESSERPHTVSFAQKDDEENNLESYDLANIENENSELEDLMGDVGGTKPDSNIETETAMDNSPKSNDLNNKSIVEEVTVDIILNTYSKKTLEELCGSDYLSKSGNKSVLVQRLLDNGYKFNPTVNTQLNNEIVVN